MAKWLQWRIPAALATLGFAIAMAGFVYDLAFVGLPYQDPTPEMQTRWQYYSSVAMAIELAGVGIMLVGVAGFAVVALWSLTAKGYRSRRYT